MAFTVFDLQSKNPQCRVCFVGSSLSKKQNYKLKQLNVESKVLTGALHSASAPVNNTSAISSVFTKVMMCRLVTLR